MPLLFLLLIVFAIVFFLLRILYVLVVSVLREGLRWLWRHRHRITSASICRLEFLCIHVHRHHWSWRSGLRDWGLRGRGGLRLSRRSRSLVGRNLGGISISIVGRVFLFLFFLLMKVVLGNGWLLSGGLRKASPGLWLIRCSETCPWLISWLRGRWFFYRPLRREVLHHFHILSPLIFVLRGYL